MKNLKSMMIGVMIGLLIASSGAYAVVDFSPIVQEQADADYVGQTIDGEMPISVNGENLPIPAIYVNGTSFLPVRAFGESVSMAVYYNPEGEILMQSTEDTRLFTFTAEQQQKINADKIEAIQKDITMKQERLEAIQPGLQEIKQRAMDSGLTAEESEQTQSYKTRLKAIADIQTEIVGLQAQIDALEE